MQHGRRARRSTPSREAPCLLHRSSDRTGGSLDHVACRDMLFEVIVIIIHTSTLDSYKILWRQKSPVIIFTCKIMLFSSIVLTLTPYLWSGRNRLDDTCMKCIGNRHHKEENALSLPQQLLPRCHLKPAFVIGISKTKLVLHETSTCTTATSSSERFCANLDEYNLLIR